MTPNTLTWRHPATKILPFKISTPNETELWAILAELAVRNFLSCHHRFAGAMYHGNIRVITHCSYCSSASIWEASIKIRLGELDADIDKLVNQIEVCGFHALPVRMAHAAKVRHLPDIHHDPFDRLLIAQAMTEPLTLLTVNSQLAAYTELVITV